mmetsp:Transcript_32972/g.74536  ORF Transcript_32972/g.74536 Transcript_32972/m.74536 type:complete len:218 (+) Transcript_32972:596-1249(+)|eukprot:CAMPEP_0181195338 /NCGR_PEP_ID=MMETSP1096-20121128/14831_1 /TAXON_ID=156174 ORGANISM="Chrysochromulina ericina, Strain CCMP281" /NCGR_SAMPLE_ID=MMETSP1096 /ASSEMBLY_ACC=CAM_ASM_000453 /LENGTH=217 /DNA_ID=CAMNT_0023284929 /DNA_START=559 /DNA_END=1212 /DNA_ORIENTATION=-
MREPRALLSLERERDIVAQPKSTLAAAGCTLGQRSDVLLGRVPCARRPRLAVCYKRDVAAAPGTDLPSARVVGESFYGRVEQQLWSGAQRCKHLDHPILCIRLACDPIEAGHRRVVVGPRPTNQLIRPDNGEPHQRQTSVAVCKRRRCCVPTQRRAIDADACAGIRVKVAGALGRCEIAKIVHEWDELVHDELAIWCKLLPCHLERDGHVFDPLIEA